MKMNEWTIALIFIGILASITLIGLLYLFREDNSDYKPNTELLLKQKKKLQEGRDDKAPKS